MLHISSHSPHTLIPFIPFTPSFLFRDRITALQISSDCRWLLSASMDGTLRVWDIPTARCLQVCGWGAGSGEMATPSFSHES